MSINTLGDQYIAYNRNITESSGIHNPPNYLFTLHHFFSRKYNSFKFSYELICINNLIFNEKCRIVARFKDYLILDDNTEFLRKYYKKKALSKKLTKIFDFYESYCKIFPNYMILPENVFLYKNIRRKQKMLDAINKIKHEEDINRKKLKLGEWYNNRSNASNLFFTKKIKDSINKFNPSVTDILSCTRISEIQSKKNNSNKKDKKKPSKRILKKNDMSNLNETENELVSLKDIMHNKKKSSFDNSNDDSDSKTLNSQSTIKNIIKTLTSARGKQTDRTNSNNKNKNIKKIGQTSQNKHFHHLDKKTKKSIYTHDKIKSANNKLKKLISHKPTGSVPTIYNLLTDNKSGSSIKIFNNVHNIIINDENNKTTSNIKNGMVININNNYFQLKNAKNSLRKILKNIQSKDKKKSNFNKNEFKLLQKRLYLNDTISNSKNNTKNISLKPLLSKLFSPNNQIRKKLSPVSKESASYSKKINENKIIKTESCNKFRLYFNIKTKNKLEGLSDKHGRQHQLSIDRKIIKNFVANNQNRIFTNSSKKNKFSKQLYEKIIPNTIKNNHNPLNETYTKTFTNLIRNTIINNRINKNITELKKMNNNLITSKKNCLISPIEYRLGKKNFILKNSTNSFQVNNKIKMKSYFSLSREKTPFNYINDKKENKLNNSEENIYISSYNNIINSNKKISTEAKGKYKRIKISKKLNTKELKRKYHYFIRTKNNRGSYDISNRLNLFNQFHTFNSLSESIDNTIMANDTNSNNYLGNNTTHLFSENVNNKTKSFKKKIYNKKTVLSPNNQKNNLSHFLKTFINQQKNSTGRNKLISPIDKNKLIYKSKQTKKIDFNVKCKAKKIPAK